MTLLAFPLFAERFAPTDGMLKRSVWDESGV